jgi:hypothetical protein
MISMRASASRKRASWRRRFSSRSLASAPIWRGS